MAKNGRFTLAEHRELGRELYERRHQLLRTANTISNTYGIGTMVSRRAHKAVAQLEQMRSSLDGQFARDFPGSYCPDVYYPGPDGDRDGHKARGCTTCYPQ